MINAYKEGKDLYAMIASKVYHNNYEDNLEFNPVTKQMQPDGKKRRTSVKGLLLGRRKFHSLDLKHNAPLYSNVY